MPEKKQHFQIQTSFTDLTEGPVGSTCFMSCVQPCVLVCIPVTCSTCAFWRKLRLCAERSREAFASPMGMPSLHPLRQLGQRWPWPWAHACTHTKQWDYFLWLSHHPHTLPAAVCMKACIKLSLHQSATWCQSIKQYNNITHTLIKNKR